ncbi:hypothetical protein [Nocardia sp. XZ_19_385]|uniref:hypothetical protein n=1 Tax=Nocardia sp. XZ_19_385 TaxID=2769488 RepID=UPI0018909F72|nr:hypothetical protein [Nocardia sp. XZ_19_385]
MPTQLHEVIVEMFRNPSLAAGLLDDAFGIPVPEYQQARAGSCDFTDVKPNEYRGDATLVFADSSGTPVLGIIVEVQLSHDDDKTWAWPVYLSTFRSRLRCPVFLLVICTTNQIAAKCRTPIRFGHPGLVLCPLVLGPDSMPVVTDPEEGRELPERAVLSALAHGGGPHAEDVLTAFTASLGSIDEEHAKMYYDLVENSIPEALQPLLRELMMKAGFKYEYQSDFARKYMAEGRAEGLNTGRAEGRAESAAQAVLAVLDTRGFEIPDALRARITECRDVDQLKAWLRRAITITDPSELFS